MLAVYVDLARAKVVFDSFGLKDAPNFKLMQRTDCSKATNDENV